MKIKMILSDIEIEIDDPDEKDRSRLLGDGLGCIESMLQSRLAMYGVCSEDEEEENELSRKMPEGTEREIKPDIQMANIYG